MPDLPSGEIPREVGEDNRGREAMTAAQAIRRECKWCSAVTPEKCDAKMCKLSPKVFECRSSVKRIRVHCLQCAAQDIGETAHEAVKTCEGRLLRENGNAVRWADSEGTERGVCFLHPYRLGKNPYRPKRKAPPGQGQRGAEALAKYRRERTTGVQDPASESTISPKAGEK
jgi:hypothetical protein